MPEAKTIRDSITAQKGTIASLCGWMRDALSRNGLMLLIAIYFLLPQFFSSIQLPAPWLGLPRVYSGDEPHYLLYLNSILEDGDLELSNNYASVHEGSNQAGQRLAGTCLDHHSIWFAEGKRQQWHDFYRTAREWAEPRLKENVSDPRPHAEYPWNLPGLSILLSLVLFPLKGSDWLEPAAVFVSYLATVAAAFLFRHFLPLLRDDPGPTDMIAAVCFLGSPLWHYSRALFPESFLTLFVLGGFYFHFKGRFLYSGLGWALAFFLKPPIILTALPLWAITLWKNRPGWWAAAIPVAAVVGIFLSMNAILLDGPARSPVGVGFVNPLTTLGGLLFSEKGLLTFSPVVVFALVGWARHFKQPNQRTVAVLLGWLSYFAFVSMINKWDGGYCFGPRYLTPLLPLMFAGLSFFPLSGGIGRQIAVWVLFVVSFVINALGALPYWLYWSKHPLTSLVSSFL